MASNSYVGRTYKEITDLFTHNPDFLGPGGYTQHELYAIDAKWRRLGKTIAAGGGRRG